MKELLLGRASHSTTDTTSEMVSRVLERLERGEMVSHHAALRAHKEVSSLHAKREVVRRFTSIRIREMQSGMWEEDEDEVSLDEEREAFLRAIGDRWFCGAEDMVCDEDIQLVISEQSAGRLVCTQAHKKISKMRDNSDELADVVMWLNQLGNLAPSRACRMTTRSFSSQVLSVVKPDMRRWMKLLIQDIGDLSGVSNTISPNQSYLQIWTSLIEDQIPEMLVEAALAHHLGCEQLTWEKVTSMVREGVTRRAATLSPSLAYWTPLLEKYKGEGAIIISEEEFGKTVREHFSMWQQGRHPQPVLEEFFTQSTHPC